ncbi:hypothetical protein PGTUg99_004737 [Puccinia graminis f. sp. tritici]|uniref:Uncharacterized protein n=1 Tax=Puccinia graminis f. sp. tritici TaxID=56615 RepID=A0A5B0RWE2_PUCGR|nr:hypothetical protein PGTUg99_004737 [Puccinia graminis f. sp. tritici]
MASLNAGSLDQIHVIPQIVVADAEFETIETGFSIGQPQAIGCKTLEISYTVCITCSFLGACPGFDAPSHQCCSLDETRYYLAFQALDTPNDSAPTEHHLTWS